MKHTLSYIKNHPNPQWTRPDWIDLNGPWLFKFDPNNQGIKESWYHGFDSAEKILVPYNYQSPKSNIDYTNHIEVVWYQKNLEHVAHDKRVLLHLEGSDFKTDVYLNGHHIKTHIGAYQRHTTDITNYLKNTDNVLVIRVEDSFDAQQPRGKQRWKTPSYECFYIETSGIYKPVWLEYVGHSYLKHSKLTPEADQFLLHAEHQIDGDLTHVKLEAKILFDGQVIHQSIQDVNRSFFLASYDIKTDSQTMKLHMWHPNHPNLYDVVFTLYKDDLVVDQVTTYFGVTKWQSQGKTIYLNAVPIYLKMILDQGYFGDGHLTATEDELKQDVEIMKTLGYNGVRKHEKIEDQRFHYYCDILGLVAWAEMPSFYAYSDQANRYFANQWPQIIKQLYNHPSIMTWVIINESWGVIDIATNKKQQTFVDGLYFLTKSYDQNRFVVSNDGWEHTHSDLITLHNYRETYHELKNAYKHIDDILNNCKQGSLLPKAPLVTGYPYQGQPLILSEFGGIAFDKDTSKGWGYGNSVKSEDEFIDKLSEQMKAILENQALSGYCFTQLTDVQQEVNGLLTEDRRYKVDPKKIKSLNAF